MVVVVGHPIIIGVVIERIAASVAHGDIAAALHVDLVEIAAEGSRKQVERIDVVTGVYIHIVHITGIGAPAVDHLCIAGADEGALHMTVGGGGLLRHVVVAVIHRQDGLAQLCCQIGPETRIPERIVGTGQRPCHACHLFRIHHHDVKDGIHPLGVLTCAGVGNDLYPLHRRSGHGL